MKIDFKDRIIILLLALVLFTALAFYFDEILLSAITGLQSSLTNVLMSGITDIAEIYLGVLVIFIVLIAARQKRLFWDLLAAMIIDVLLIITLKIVIARPRPYMQGFSAVSNSFMSAFPSGHASRAFVMFGTMAKHWKHWKLTLYFIAIVISFSRLYLGVHWPSDVAFGALLGMIISEVVVRFNLGVKLEKDCKLLWKKLRG